MRIVTYSMQDRTAMSAGRARADAFFRVVLPLFILIVMVALFMRTHPAYGVVFGIVTAAVTYFSMDPNRQGA